MHGLQVSAKELDGFEYGLLVVAFDAVEYVGDVVWLAVQLPGYGWDAVFQVSDGVGVEM